jgi:hypothetical protein
MNSEALDKEIARYKVAKSLEDPAAAFIKKLGVSDDAKARIEAILAEEAQKRG